MPNTVRTAEYYKMIVPHKSGQGLKILNHLQKSKVDLLSLLAFPKKRKAQLDFVPVDAAKFTAAAKLGKWKIKGPKTCFIITSKDQVGALVPYVTKLTKAKINIRATAAVSGGDDRCGAILWVDPKNVERATEVLGAKT